MQKLEGMLDLEWTGFDHSAKELSGPAAEMAISATVGPKAVGGNKGGVRAMGLPKIVQWALAVMIE
jgi:hypothetical protein